MILSGWNNYPRVDVKLIQARGDEEIRASLKKHHSLIARGNGRAYGDAAMNREATLSLLPSDRILAFDPETGLLTCEAGLLLADLLDLFVPRGWFVAVTPGTKFVTLGGMIAADVHGKNHHAHGSFCDHLESFTLMLADGQLVTCSPTRNLDLFAATCGGMGLTGIIVTATLRLIKIQTAYIRQKTVRAANLVEVMEIFEASTASTYSVAWIDGLAQGSKIGRSLVYLGEHAKVAELSSPGVDVKNPLKIKPHQSKQVPFYFPHFVLNRWSVTAFNELYYAKGHMGLTFVDYETFFYPLDALHQWNRIYGRRGFIQYQCVLPKAASAAGLAGLFDRIGKSGLAPFLATLKLLGTGHGFLSFPMEGYTLALDFPVCRKTFELLNQLDAVVTDYGGRIYLAKDARMSASMLQHGYPELEAFLKLRHRVDPEGKFSSLQSTRLGLSL